MVANLLTRADFRAEAAKLRVFRRRRAERAPVGFSATLSFDGQTKTVRVLDLSTTGLLLQTDVPPDQQQDHYCLAYTLLGTPLVAALEVARCIAQTDGTYLWGCRRRPAHDQGHHHELPDETPPRHLSELASPHPPGQVSASRSLLHKWLALPDLSSRKRLMAAGAAAVSLCMVLLTAIGPLAGLKTGALRTATADAAVGSDGASPAVSPNPSEMPRTVLPFGALTPAVLTASRPTTVAATLQAASGGAIVAGNVGLSFSPDALAEVDGDVQVRVESQPSALVPGGPAQFSPNGSLVAISVTDHTGRAIRTFPQPVDILFKYNAADLAMARGDPAVLKAAYVLDDNAPDLANPLHFPAGTWLFFPDSVTTVDAAARTVSVRTQTIDSIVSVVANLVGYAQTLRPATALYSSFDRARAQVFGTKPQFSYLQVMEPQIGGRLVVLDPETRNYAYVNAADVGPSGPPPGQQSRLTPLRR